MLLPALLAAVLPYVVGAATLSFIPILAGQLGAGDAGQSLTMTLHVGLVAVASFVNPSASVLAAPSCCSSQPAAGSPTRE